MTLYLQKKTNSFDLKNYWYALKFYIYALKQYTFMYSLQIVWDPIKFIDLGFFKLHFYSLMWITAFLLGFRIMKRIYKNEGQSEDSLDSLFIYSVLGIMLGARLGHVIFYQPDLITEDFFSIFLPFKFKVNCTFNLGSLYSQQQLLGDNILRWDRWETFPLIALSLYNLTS